jgi:hypothetical protein
MSLRQHVLGIVIALTAMPSLAAGVDGKWKTKVDAGPQGPVELVFDLKAEGNKLKGTLSGPILATPASITDGVIEADRVSFSVTMAIMPGMPPVLIGYSGTVNGDEMHLSAGLDMGHGHMSIPVVAVRVK